MEGAGKGEISSSGEVAPVPLVPTLGHLLGSLCPRSSASVSLLKNLGLWPMAA